MPNTGQLHWDHRDGRVAAVAAAIAYSFWVLEIVLPGAAGEQGALATAGSTLQVVLENAHRTAAILVLVAAGLGMALGVRRHGRALTVSWVSTAVFGAASLAASLFSGPCVVSTDVSCASESLAEGVAGASVAQALTAVLAVLAALAAVVALAVDRWSAADRARLLVVTVAVLQVVAATLVLVTAVVVYASSGDGASGVALGLLERFHLVTLALWLVVAGVLPGPWKKTPVRAPAAVR
ncbi:hypothetical protein [Nocardiopsis kunsanensis]|uniref:DUF998 domain-containing protein n=1 Tax=Nocardiopsis kunsanensis TaxID=141693 RepID=A0A918XJ45_9ACTN|nr:hypothetical protein [Nocardiopsis kunsanensis]GHD33218.1 hypothetical protein GCM10007147_37630 [Nocardiopsis kunsanensis]